MNIEDIKSRTKFCHYTTIDNARKILSSGTVFMSRLDTMNDLLETQDHEEEKNQIYVASFSNSEARSIPMFYLYGGIDGKGCRIEFSDARLRDICRNHTIYPVNEHYIRINKPIDESQYSVFVNWVLCKVKDKSRGYFKGKNITEGNEQYDEFIKMDESKYFIKAPWWEYEKEFRIVVKLRNSCKYERIAFIFSTKDKDKGISVTFGPETTDEELAKQIEEFKEYGILNCGRISDKQISMNLVKKNKHLFT